MSLFGGNALVTGAGSGIGRAVAILYVREGVQGIAIADFNTESVAETERLIKKLSPKVNVVAIEADVSNLKSVKEMVAKASTLGPINYAANVAGVAPKQDSVFVTETVEAYEAIQNVNAKGVFLCLQEELKVMLKQDARPSPLPYETTHTAERGSIVNVASVAGLFGLNTLASYVASKHACLGLTKTAATESARSGVRVNAVCPSYIETPMLHNITKRRGLEPHSEKSDELWAVVNSRNPTGRLGRAEEVAEACVFLTSHRSTFINGQCLSVDGGQGGAYSYTGPTSHV